MHSMMQSMECIQGFHSTNLSVVELVLDAFHDVS